MSIDYVLARLDAIDAKLKAHCEDHPLEHHDHLMDPEEHVAHHTQSDKSREKRSGEQRKGERRTSTEPYTGEERRAA
jgi:hypothetical protein